MTRVVDFMIKNEFVTPQEVYLMWKKMPPSTRKSDVLEKTALRYRSDGILNDNKWLLELLMARRRSKMEAHQNSRWHPLLVLDQDVFYYIIKLVPLHKTLRRKYHYSNIIDCDSTNYNAFLRKCLEGFLLHRARKSIHYVRVKPISKQLRDYSCDQSDSKQKLRTHANSRLASLLE